MTIMLVCNRAEQCVCNGDRVWQDIRCHHCQLSIHPPKKIFNIFILSYDFFLNWFFLNNAMQNISFLLAKCISLDYKLRTSGATIASFLYRLPKNTLRWFPFNVLLFFALPLFAPGDRSSLRHSVPLCQCRSGSNAFTRPRSNVIPESPGPV